MKTTLNRISTAAIRRVQYHRTVSAIRSIPESTAQDLNLPRSDARRIAREVVYGV